MVKQYVRMAVSVVEGELKVDWNKDTKILEVTFDDTKTTSDKIELAIAKAGHDTPHHKASTEVYNELPDCCKYDRLEMKMDGSHEGHKH